MRKTIVLPVALVFAVAGVVSLRGAANNSIAPVGPRPIPEIEAERLSVPTLDRTDTGKLTPEAYAQQLATVSTRSTEFVMEGVTATTVSLPVTGDKAKIAVFSPAGGELDVRLSDPMGNPVSASPFTHSEDVEPGAASKVVRGTGGDGVMIMTDPEQMMPGAYTLAVDKAQGPLTVVVNDVGGPELVLWPSQNGVDSSRPITLFAKIVDGDATIAGAQLVATVSGLDKRYAFAENEPGLYSTTIKAAGLSSMPTIVVEATGTTANGLALKRHGSYSLMTGKANSELLSVASEAVTDTDLEVAVEVNVKAAGRFYLSGNLISAAGEPIAWAQDAQELTKGRHTLTLHFSRQVIAESGVASGFVLANVELMNVTTAPGVKAVGTISAHNLSAEL